MTEKRFEIKIGEFEEENIVDNLNRMTIREISDMCKKMNELHEENKELKSKCEFMEKILENKGYTVEYDTKKDKWVLE